MKVISTKTSQKALSFLADYPNQQFFGSQIAKKTKVSLGAAHQTLKKLTKKKLIFAEKKGRMIFYQINNHHPLVKQIKITDSVNQLTKLIERLKPNCQHIILFGSSARGENTIESDIDLFVLTHEPEGIRKIINKEKNKLQIVPIIKTPNQWAEQELKDPEFFQEVSRGITLYQKDE